MPPKKGPSAKTIAKEKEKIVEDKTFGLKNKNKSKKVQQYVKSVKTVVDRSGPKMDDKEREKEREKQKRLAEKKAAELKKIEDERILRASIVQPKVPPGVDPKSFVCEFWKQGCCSKGDKCKFAHDLNAGRRAEKIDLYTDRRAGADAAAPSGDTIDSWDTNKLEKVVDTKRTTTNRNLKTSIVCKFFLEALDTRKYGWFWECPNGETCQYVHCLPPGFVLKPREVKIIRDDDEDEPGVEDEIEKERAKLKGGEPVTKESFARWKAEKIQKKAEEAKKKEDERRTAIAAGRTVLLSGRELLVYKPTLFVDDEEAASGDELVAMTGEEFDAAQNALDSDAPGEDVGEVEADLFLDEDEEGDGEDEDEDGEHEQDDEAEEGERGDDEAEEEEKEEEQEKSEEVKGGEGESAQ